MHEKQYDDRRPKPELTPEQFRRRIVYSLVMLVIILVGCTVFNVVYTNYVDRRSNRNWCETLEALDQPPPANATDRIRDIQARLHRLNVKQGCIRD